MPLEQVYPEVRAHILGEKKKKLAEYFAIGVGQVWLVAPESREVLVYDSPVQLCQFGEGERLAGEGVLEGFAVEIEGLFGADD